MRFVPVPGLGIPTHNFPILDSDRNMAAWLDRGINAFTQAHLHTGSLYNHTRDPEGLLSTLPAIATTLIGCLTGLWLRMPHDPRKATAPASALQGCHSERSEGSLYLSQQATEIISGHRLRVLLLGGALCLSFGLLWSHWFPLNKNLWTSSYVLFSAGLSLLLLALCYWLIDIRRLNATPVGKCILWPWLVFGSNAIAAYLVSNLIVETMLWIKMPCGALVDPQTHLDPLPLGFGPTSTSLPGTPPPTTPRLPSRSLSSSFASSPTGCSGAAKSFSEFSFAQFAQQNRVSSAKTTYLIQIKRNRLGTIPGRNR